MRGVLTGFTTRGRSFLAAGIAAAICGIGFGERDLIRIGVLLIALPMLSGLAVGRTRYRLACARRLTPSRVPVGQHAEVAVRLDNVSRLHTGLLLIEDTVPYSLGSRPRFVIEGVEPRGSRELSYRVRSDLRGRFTIGPLRVHIADPFGLVELSRSFASSDTLVVPPKVVPLPRTRLVGEWLGGGESKARTVAAAGEDDVAPRGYRYGDDLRRVHWRSTARYGELMVRREEQQWHSRAALLLDTRRYGHVGDGVASSFEFAVSAAASIGVHLAREGFDMSFVTDQGIVDAPGLFEDVLLDTLAVARPSRNESLHRGLAALDHDRGGLVVAVIGRIDAGQARELARTRHGAASCVAVLLEVSTWLGSSNHRDRGDADGVSDGSGHKTEARPGPRSGGAARRRDPVGSAADILRAGGWRVLTISADATLPTAWRRLDQPSADVTAERMTEVTR